MPSFRDFAGSRFEAAERFGSKTIKGKIIECGPETVEGKDHESSTVLAIRLNNHDKLFRVNITNGERLATKWGDNYEKWISRIVQIRTINVQMGGKTVKGFEMTPVGK